MKSAPVAVEKVYLKFCYIYVIILKCKKIKKAIDKKVDFSHKIKYI